jgi:hypothetical protein
LQILGPVLERLENELLNPLISRTFAIMFRAGLFPPPPPEIAGIELKIQYISVLAQAQKMASISAIDQWAIGVMNEAQINPESLDIINFDIKNSEKADMLGVPAKIVNTPDAILARRQARAQAQAEAQKAQMMQQTAMAGKDGASAIKSLSDAKIGGQDGQGSALDAMSQVMGGQL